ARDLTSLFANGTGEVASPFIINTVVQFDRLKTLGAAFVQKEYSNWEFKLGADLDFSAATSEVRCINYFSGNIDGAGHTITNATVKNCPDW
ncbi:MAG: hypothetical protein RR274_07015, partial [Erysipelotrichaceae bacterium]